MIAPGTVIFDRYRVVRQIGQGGMGSVYEATDLRLHNTVALKQMLLSGEPLRRAFEHEAQVLAGLRHPGLPKVFDHFAQDKAQFLVMEFIPGEDLAATSDELRPTMVQPGPTLAPLLPLVVVTAQGEQAPELVAEPTPMALPTLEQQTFTPLPLSPTALPGLAIPTARPVQAPNRPTQTRTLPSPLPTTQATPEPAPGLPPTSPLVPASVTPVVPILVPAAPTAGSDERSRPVPPTTIPPTTVPLTEVPPGGAYPPPTEVPPTQVPPTEVPPTEIPPTVVVPTDVPTAYP